MKNIKVGSRNHHDTLAERSKAVAQGAIPKGRGFEPHRCHLYRTFGIVFRKFLASKANFPNSVVFEWFSASERLKRIAIAGRRISSVRKC